MTIEHTSELIALANSECADWNARIDLTDERARQSQALEFADAAGLGVGAAIINHHTGSNTDARP